MPKRSQLFDSKNKVKVCQKSGLIDDSCQLSDVDDDNQEEVPAEKSKKCFQYLKLNKDNELERLLLHNSKELMYHVDHSDFPAFNVSLWPQQSDKNLTNYPSCMFSTPRSLLVSNKQNEKVDICYKRPMSRYFYTNRMKHTRASYKTALKSNKNIRSSIKDQIYHSSVFDMAERVYMEPDPFFHSSYDFYFAGGNLSVSRNRARVLHAGGDQLQEISASEFRVVDGSNGTECLQQVASLRMSEKGEIFEVHPLITSLENSIENYFILRQRNLITLNYLNDQNQIKTVKQFRSKSTPFISFAQSGHDINNFIITTMKQHIRLYDLNCNVPKLVKLFQISPNSAISWNTIKPWRENTFLYANEKNLFKIDIRTSPEQWFNQVTFDTDGLICDHISAVQPSNFNNLFYVATNHKLKCMDIRMLRRNSLSNSDQTICGWSHQLCYAPLMIDTLRSNQNEIIALSSPIAGDLHIFQLSRERKRKDSVRLESPLHIPKHCYSSPCLSYQPPTLLESYENARLSGKCLNPKANLEARLKCCTTGMKFINSSLENSNCGIGLLMTLNSNGDIFAHTVSKREENESEDRSNRQSDEVMAEFERKIYQQTQMALKYTEIKNMRGLRKVVLCNTLSCNKKYDIDSMDEEFVEAVTKDSNANNNPPKKSRSMRRLGRWQKSLSRLHSYKDALVTDLLSIWDIDIEEEQNCHQSHFRHGAKIDPAVKVNDWLDQNINPYPVPMVSIPGQEANMYSENNISQNFDTTLTQTQNTTITFENVVHSTEIFDNSLNTSILKNVDTSDAVIQINNETSTTLGEKFKSKKKNKKYMKGF